MSSPTRRQMRRRACALLVLTLLLAPGLPGAFAAAPSDPTSAPDVIARVYGDRLHASPSMPLNASHEVDLTFTNITDVAAGAAVELRHPDNATVLATQTAYPNADASGTVNVTFPALALRHGGDHVLASGGFVRLLRVDAADVIDVVFSTNPLRFTEGAVSLSITTVLRTNGTPASHARVEFPWSPYAATTDANGAYHYFGAAPAVGSHAVRATRDADGDGITDQRGENALVVTPAVASVAPVRTAVFAGFSDVSEWNLTYPTNATPLLAGPRKYLHHELVVALPNGSRLLVSSASAGETPDANFSGEVVHADANWTVQPPVPDVVWTYNTSTSHFAFRPGATWGAGTYVFSLRVNTRVGDVNDSASDVRRAEYVATWSLTPATPAPVNLVAYHPGTNDTLVDLDVRPPGAGPTVGAHAIDLVVRGSLEGETPQDPAFADNVSVRGHVLPGWRVASYDPETGRARLEGVAPTHVRGEVQLAVSWKNVTTTLTLPITRGALVNATPQEIPPDRVSSVNVTVRDAFGNHVPNAVLTIFALEGGAYPGVGVLTINGTGAPGVGQDGVYAVSLAPSANGTLVVHAQIGQGATNHSYAPIRVAWREPVLTATVWPSRVPAGEPSSFRVHVREDGASATSPHEVRICDAARAACSAPVTTDAYGYAYVWYLPPSAGAYDVLVDGSALATIHAVSYLRAIVSPATLVLGDDARLHVYRSDDGAPVGAADVYVYRDGALVQRLATNSSGGATIVAPEAGSYEIAVAKAGFVPVELSFDVLPRPRFQVDDASVSLVAPQTTTLRMHNVTSLRDASVTLRYDPAVATLAGIRAQLPNATVTWNHDPERGVLHVVVGTVPMPGARDLDLLDLTWRPTTGSLPGDATRLDLEGGRAYLAIGRALSVESDDGRLHHGLLGAPYNRAVIEALENLL